MMVMHVIKKTVANNAYLIMGILLGVALSHYFDNTSECEQQEIVQPSHDAFVPSTTVRKQPSMNSNTARLVKKSPVTKKDSEKLVRPRYYSTELGIRDKLFVGVLTSEEKINTQAVYINKTIAHVADKVKFFITAHNKMKTTFNLTGIVGFTDTRHKYRPFQIIKYIGESFMQDYDYYFLMNDHNHLNARKLKEIVGEISVSKDVYLGTLAEESSFCNLDAGILLSNSVVRAMKENLEWCISNAVSDDHSENLGRCVHHSTNLECQSEVQGQSLPTYKLKHFQLSKYLEKLTRRADFGRAVTIHPVLHAKDFYLLNAYFSRQRLESIVAEISELSRDLNDTWPPGQKVGARPATRFDLQPQLYFNMTHTFFPDDFTNVRRHVAADYLDIKKIVEAVKNKVKNENRGGLQFRRLVNGYRSFDLSRGMDYMLDLGFRDLNTGKEVIKRFEVCKPLGKVEFVPAPYVTENPRVAILLPVQETQTELALNFIRDYSKTVMERKEKTLLILVLFYQYSSSSKGTNDVFAELKNLALKLSNKYRNEESKIIWISIRLPTAAKAITLEEHGILNYAMVDLALKKIGLESLTLILDVFADVSVEFLNRVRMNTIINFQVFSPIPFRQYDPKVTRIDKLEVNKNVGHFDREDYKYVSFYGKDYVYVRKKSQNEVPLVRTDNDIAQIIPSNNKGNVFELFVKYSDNIHCMRATEKDLKVRHHEDVDGDDRKNFFFGTKVQLAKLLLTHQDKISVLL